MLKTENTIAVQDVMNNAALYWTGLKPAEVSSASKIMGGGLCRFTELSFKYIVPEGRNLRN